MMSATKVSVTNRDLFFSDNSLARVMIGSVLERLGSRATPEPVGDVLDRYLAEYTDSRHGYGSFMTERFHPAMDPTPFLRPRMKDMEWLATKTGLPVPTDVTPTSLQEWVTEVGHHLGVLEVTGFMKTSDKKVETIDRGAKETRGWTADRCTQARAKAKQKFRKTCSAKFLLKDASLMEGTPFESHSDRMRGVRCLSVLQGRLHIWGDSWLTAHALQIAKTGLVLPLMEETVKTQFGGWDKFASDFPATFSLMAVLVSVFSERKAFTLGSQKQGGLNSYMEELLEIVKTTEPKGLIVIGLILPLREVYSRMPKEMVELVYTTSMKWLETFAPFLERQWKRGVNKCVRRMCRVPPRGTGVNSSGYNAVADAWQNLRRFQTIASEFAGIKDAPLILKVLQLIADDQFRWGSGKIDPNTHVYKTLTREVLPWDAVLRPESFDTGKALAILFRECKEHKVPISSWIAVAGKRKGEVSHPVDMICGVAVPPMSEECANFLKNLGLFGAGSWSGASASAPDVAVGGACV